MAVPADCDDGASQDLWVYINDSGRHDPIVDANAALHNQASCPCASNTKFVHNKIGEIDAGLIHPSNYITFRCKPCFRRNLDNSSRHPNLQRIVDRPLFERATALWIRRLFLACAHGGIEGID